MSRISSYRCDGLTFDVTDEGPLDGDVVVLLHGFPERASCWRLVAPLLHAEGYRTLAPDQRGYSPGARPRRRRDYTTAHLADDVAALARASGGPVHLVGHDWGAIVAWATVARHPDLVRTLTAVSVPHPAAYTQALRRSRQALRSWYMLAFNLPWVPEMTARSPRGPFYRALRGSGMSADDVERVRTEVVEHGALPGGLAYYRALPFADRAAMRARVTVPTTLVWSDGDRFLDREGARLTAGRMAPGTDYAWVTLEGVSHWIPTQAPEPLAEAILARIGTG